MADDFPPPPPGATPISAAGDSDFPPPPPGATPIGAAPVERPKESWLRRSGLVGPARQHPDSLWGRFTESDPITKLTLQDATTGSANALDTYKNVGLGAAGSLSGAAELVPGAHPYAASLSRQITEQVTNPNAYSIGATLPFLAGGEFLGAGKAASLVPKVAAEAPGVLAGAGRVASGVGKGAVGGGVIGAETGLAAPTGKENYADSLDMKLETAVDEGEGFALQGAALGGGFSLAGEAAGVAGTLTGGKIASTLETVKDAAQRVGYRSVDSDKFTAADASKRAAEAQTRVEKTAADLKAIEEQHHQLALDQAQREAAIAGNAVNVADIRARTSAAMRDRVRQAEEDAKAAGLSTEQAHARVIEAERTVVETEQAARQIADDMAKSGGFLSANDFGAMLQATAVRIYERLVKAREEAAGFGKAVQSAGDEMRVSTEDAAAFIDSSLQNIRDPKVASLLRQVRKQLYSRVQTGVNDAGKPVFDYLPKLNIESADSARKYIQRLLDQSETAVQATDEAGAKAARHFLEKVRDRVSDGAKEAWPPYAQAMKTFAEMSKPIDDFNRKGALSAVVRTDEKTRELKMLTGQVTSALLQKTGKGANAFGRLVAENPKLKDAARDFFRQQLFGVEGLEKGITPDKLRAFLIKNDGALKQTGLYDEFSAAHTTLEGAKGAIETAKSAAGEAKTAAAETKAREAKASGKVAADRKLADLAQQREREVGQPTPSEKVATERNAEAVRRLKVTEAAKREDLKSLQSELDAAVKTGEVSAQSAHDVRRLMESVERESLTPSQVADRADTLFSNLEKQGKITSEELKTLQQDVDRLRGAVVNQKWARAVVRRAVIGAVILAFGYEKARNIHITTNIF